MREDNPCRFRAGDGQPHLSGTAEVVDKPGIEVTGAAEGFFSHFRLDITEVAVIQKRASAVWIAVKTGFAVLDCQHAADALAEWGLQCTVPLFTFRVDDDFPSGTAGFGAVGGDTVKLCEIIRGDDFHG